mmetsp:Transcript_111821/g.326977  ORF Transcript_111821/g.326977 Transcript_111821/m.326977 type:complete len:222 (+) Transcript_111821:332-997(+)
MLGGRLHAGGTCSTARVRGGHEALCGLRRALRLRRGERRRAGGLQRCSHGPRPCLARARQDPRHLARVLHRELPRVPAARGPWQGLRRAGRLHRERGADRGALHRGRGLREAPDTHGPSKAGGTALGPGLPGRHRGELAAQSAAAALGQGPGGGGGGGPGRRGGAQGVTRGDCRQEHGPKLAADPQGGEGRRGHTSQLGLCTKMKELLEKFFCFEQRCAVD